MADYWDPVAHVLPQHVRDAMSKAVTAETHRPNRDWSTAEPVLMAGIRELLRHVTLNDVADEQLEQHVRQARREAERHREAIKTVIRDTDRLRADEHNALVRVWQLHSDTRGRKTVSRTDLHRALAPHEYESEAVL